MTCVNFSTVNCFQCWIMVIWVSNKEWIWKILYLQVQIISVALSNKYKVLCCTHSLGPVCILFSAYKVDWLFSCNRLWDKYFYWHFFFFKLDKKAHLNKLLFYNGEIKIPPKICNLGKTNFLSDAICAILLVFRHISETKNFFPLM